MAKIAPSPEVQTLDAEFRRLSLESLETNHRDHLTRAISNVLSTDIAEITYAQIVDGLPLSSVFDDTRNLSLIRYHPVRTQHTELCPGILERTRQLYAEFDFNVILFDARVRNIPIIDIILS
jgi:hypothetical protein